MALDPDQIPVVTALPSARQLVEAGPGCGKTHVACARVAHLLDTGEVPDRILLLSFTRTAVHELRNRIAASAKGGAPLARGVEIRTLDSLAWRLATGAREVGTIGSYEESVNAALAVLERTRRGEEFEIGEYIRRFSQVFVDEAQDLVGPRARLVLAFLNSLPATSGWTVFLDPAQAIYGWSTDAEDQEKGVRFVDMLPDLAGSVTTLGLTRIHRTSDERLLDLLRRTRSIVRQGAAGQRLAAIRTVLSEQAPVDAVQANEVPTLVESLGADAEHSLLLYRRRVDALLALSYLRNTGHVCRLRLGAMPRMAAPWIAAIACQVASSGAHLGSVTRTTFDEAWGIVCSGAWIARGWSADAAWDLLVRIASSGKSVDLRKVADRLAATVVPDEAFTKELGPGGPVIGTVHGSKGREAKRVIFCVPEDENRPGSANAADPGAQDLSDEEARVMYVAVSRAIDRLDVRLHRPVMCGYHEDRAWHSTSTGLQVEIGRDGDVDPAWALVMDDGQHASAIHQQLVTFDGKLRTVHVNTERGGTWTRRLETDHGSALGALSMTCGDALHGLVKARARKNVGRPMRIRHLTWLDVTTVALVRDDPRTERLAFPWNETRLLLAPVVAGMGFIKRYW